MSAVDVVSDRNNVRKLLSFIDPTTTKGGLESFTIKVEIVGETAIFRRDETVIQEFIGPNDFRGFGHAFEKAYTSKPIAGATGHHRMVSYSFGDLDMLIRHETDGFVRSSSDDDKFLGLMSNLSLNRPDSTSETSNPVSKLTIKRIGQEIPLASTMEIKTRVAHKPLPMDEVAAQLWISQTPNLVRAYHKGGLFKVPTVEDATAHIERWERMNQKNLRTLIALIKKIVDVAKTFGHAEIKYDADKDKLIVRKIEAGKMLPDDVYLRWKKPDSPKAAEDSSTVSSVETGEETAELSSEDGTFGPNQSPRSSAEEEV